MKNVKDLPTITSLSSYDSKDLRQFYEKCFGNKGPRRAKKGFFMGNLSWYLQAKQSGYNPLLLREQLIKQSSKSSTHHKVHYKPGTLLFRQWQGKVYEVKVLEKGFQWQDRHYRSLSKISTEITGTRWSGPKFFGLKDTG